MHTARPLLRLRIARSDRRSVRRCDMKILCVFGQHNYGCPAQLFEAWMKSRDARRVSAWQRAEPALGIDNVFALATLLAADASRAQP